MKPGWTTYGIKQPPTPRGGTCTACGAMFSGDRAFDLHRTGPHTARRCLDAAAMRGKGLQLSPSGLWGRAYGSVA